MQGFWRQDGLAHFASFGAARVTVRSADERWNWTVYENNKPAATGTASDPATAKQAAERAVAERGGMEIRVLSNAFL